MKSLKLDSDKITKLNVELVEITNELCIFKAVLTANLNGEEIITKSEGVSNTKSVLLANKECRLPHNNPCYIKSSASFLELVRLYGHPATLSPKYTYDKFQPEPLMQKDTDNSQVKFKDLEDPDLVGKLLFINHSSHSIIKISDNSFCNVAFSTGCMCIAESRYKNYTEVVETFVNEGRINLLSDRNKSPFKTHYDSHMKYVDGKLSLSDKEFFLVIDNMTIEKHHIDKYLFYKTMEKLNTLGINKFLKTEEEKEIDYQNDNQ